MQPEDGTNLLQLSPDGVFASRGVSEVIELNKKIQYEIERKREDLRAMVGERYRELIHAADTIGEMKSTTVRTLQHLGATVALCRNLHDTHLIGFRIPEKTNYTDRSEATFSAHSVAVQVKLLLDIPEHVWKCIEQEDFLMATQLFLLARHINTGLQMQGGIKSYRGTIAPLQPLIERQWSSVSNLHHILEQASRKKLQQADLKEEAACSCLLSLYLLEPQANLLGLLSTFISLHSDGVLERLLTLEDAAEQDDQIIGERVVASARLVVRTIELVQACFVDNSGGSVLRKLKNLFAGDSPALVDLLPGRDRADFTLLPSLISSYRLTSKTNLKPLSKEEVSATISAWTESVEKRTQEKVKILLNNIPSAKILSRIREEALEIETPQNWNEICESLSMEHIDVWSQYFQPLLTARVKEIIDAKWRTVLETFKVQIVADLMRVSDVKCDEKEADLNWFVWKDLIGDTVIESRDEVVQVMNSLMKGMWLQDRGLTPSLERLCGGVDRELARLLADLARYWVRAAGAAGPAARDTDLSDDQRRDRVDLQRYLRDAAGRNVASMLKYIKDECFDNPSLRTTELQRQTTAIYCARFVQSLTHLLPSLRQCYIPTQGYQTYELNDDEGVRKWNEICAWLRESCLYCWGKWVEIAMARVEKLKEGLPREFTVEANLEYLLMQWDVITIQEKDDEGNPVESTIKIPCGPSLKLQEYLYSTSRILDQTVPHTLPREVHSSFIERVADVTLSHYEHVIREKETDINQKCALQLLMDVRHATLLLVPRENKKAVERSHEICESLRKIIDPFDYDVFYPYIQTNVKRSVQRVQTLLGDLAGSAEQLSCVLGPHAPATSAPAAPALLATPAARDWFTLLPVTAPAPLVRREKLRKKAGGPASSVSPAKSAATDISELMSSSLSGAKSGAAAFFGDWFSGS